MASIKRWCADNRSTIVGVLIVLLSHIVIMIINECSPFGDCLYVRGDNQDQLSPAIEEFKRKVVNGESIWYSFDSNGGIDFYQALTGGILCLNMLPFLLISKELFVCFINLGMMFHSLLMYIAMRYYLTHRMHGHKWNHDSQEATLFAMIYALLPAFIDAGVC